MRNDHFLLLVVWGFIESADKGYQRYMLISLLCAAHLWQENSQKSLILPWSQLSSSFVLKDFYSHTNWVEIGNTFPNANLIKGNADVGKIAGKEGVVLLCVDLQYVLIFKYTKSNVNLQPKREQLAATVLERTAETIFWRTS